MKKHICLASGTLLAVLGCANVFGDNNISLHAVMARDVSKSDSGDCEVEGSITEQILRRSYGADSSLLMMYTGDSGSANQPRRGQLFALPSSRRMLEGHGAVKKEKAELPRKVIDACRGYQPTNVSPIFMAAKTALDQLHSGGCGRAAQCVLFLQTDGEENVELPVRRALDGHPGKDFDRLKRTLNNSDVEVNICGLSETIGHLPEGGVTVTGNRDSHRVDRINTVWLALFSDQSRVHLAPFCGGASILTTATVVLHTVANEANSGKGLDSRQFVARTTASTPTAQKMALGSQNAKEGGRTAPAALIKEIDESLRKIITRSQLENVRLSWGREEGECFTNRDLQEMIAAKLPQQIAETVAKTGEFRLIAQKMKTLGSHEREVVFASRRVSYHKTWTELGIEPDSQGQSDAGKKGEILIANSIVNKLEYLVDGQI